MSLHRFFLTAALDPEATEVELPLTDNDRHHIAHALRMEPDDEIVVVEPDRKAWRLQLTLVGPHHVRGIPRERLSRHSEPHVTLVQGVMKGERMDLVVEKAVEIGVEAVMPVMMERTVVRWDAAKRAKRAERWRRVAYAAAKQSQRAFVPRIEEPLSFAQLLDSMDSFDAVVVLWEESQGACLAEVFDSLGRDPDTRLAVVVGPEGGLTEEEVRALENAGAKTASLGENILRSETAGIVGTALCVYELGGFGGWLRD